MDFAKNLMKKYGWEEGKGLGKNSEGIVQPLKASLKFDTSGLGVNKAEEFNNHWWERVFNEAANNIKIKKTQENVSIETKDDEAVEISTKNFSMKKLKKLKSKDKHKNFIKSSILKGSNDNEEILDKIDTDTVKFQQYKILTDNELFAACGGRTAHKGARHGLNLKGKLSRIEKQEEQLLLKMNNKNAQNEIKKTELKDDWNLVTSKNKRKLKDEDKTTNEDEIDKLRENLYSAEYYYKSKKKKKKDKKIENELIAVMNFAKVTENNDEKIEDVEVNTSAIKNGKRKKSKSSNNENDEKANNIKNIQCESVSSPLDGEITNFDHSSKVQEAINSNRSDEVYKKKSKKNKKCKTDNSSISKCREYKRKKKFKKSLKNISENVETLLTIS